MYELDYMDSSWSVPARRAVLQNVVEDYWLEVRKRLQQDLPIACPLGTSCFPEDGDKMATVARLQKFSKWRA
jgi:hypothetical protein